MNILASRIILLFSLFAAAQSFAAENTTEVPLCKAFIPPTFDSNDLSQVVVSGVLPSTCYRLGELKIEKNFEEQRIELRQELTQSEDVCLPVTVPFFKVVNLGRLPLGGYAIVDGASQKNLGTLAIHQASGSGPITDDYPYAEVEHISLSTDSASGLDFVTLRGEFTSRCVRLKTIHVGYFSDVIVIYPITERIDERECEAEAVRFEERIQLKALEPHAYLIHTRSKTGHSVNQIFDAATGRLDIGEDGR